ncbi:MAG: phytanoyl-CoA dioxygenase family protein [Candidatus Latescibacterota bacterium]|nr:phytanoyl-CoA dioxygenase family protein [Candidatus Latescibacterota bacterium]
MLTKEQKLYFETFGFLVLRQVFDGREVDEIRRESERILLENRLGKPFHGERRQAMIPFFEYSPVLRQIMEDDRIFQLGEDLLGPGFLLNATEGNLHTGDTQWHGGGPEPELVPHIKIAFYLEPATRDTGAIRLIPGTNNPEFRQHLQPLKDQCEDSANQPFGISGADLPCQVVETEPGDLVIFPETTWHAAFGGPPGRSQHAINFMASPVTDEEIAHIKALYESWTYSLHPAAELINSDRPRLRAMVERMVELGFGPPAPAVPFE